MCNYTKQTSCDNCSLRPTSSSVRRLLKIQILKHGQFPNCHMQFSISAPFQTAALQKKWHANKCKHLTESLSLSLFLLSTMNRSVCRTGPTADVNTAPNYKSHSKRAMLCCPCGSLHKGPAFVPKHLSLQCWEHMRQLLQTHNRGRRTSVVVGVRGMLGVFCSVIFVV